MLEETLKWLCKMQRWHCRWVTIIAALLKELEQYHFIPMVTSEAFKLSRSKQLLRLTCRQTCCMRQRGAHLDCLSDLQQCDDCMSPMRLMPCRPQSGRRLCGAWSLCCICPKRLRARCQSQMSLRCSLPVQQTRGTLRMGTLHCQPQTAMCSP